MPRTTSFARSNPRRLDAAPRGSTTPHLLFYPLSRDVTETLFIPRRVLSRSDICERGTPTASVVSDRRNPRGRQPSENHRGAARTALQRKPAQRGARTRLSDGPSSFGSPTEEWPHYASHCVRLPLPIITVTISH